MRVLLMAETCNPDWPSLPIVGYQTCKAIADEADVVIATHVRNRPAIERVGFGRASVEYLDNEYIAAPLFRFGKWLRGGDQLGWTTAMAAMWLPQIAFEWEVHKRFRAELQAGAFDLVHRVTPMSPTLPSPMARWSPVPFVIGPLNGGLRWPGEFRAELHREREHLRYLREAYRLLPYYSSTFARARCILAAFQHTLDDLPRHERHKAIDFPEVGFDPKIFSCPDERPERQQLIFLFVGRLVPYKCADLTIRAFGESDALRKHRLMIVGDGPELQRLRAMVQQYNLADCVDLVGPRSQSDVGELMRQADVFVFPSIRELGAGVVVEAMASGCVPVVVRYGAPGALVTDESGVRVDLKPKDDLVGDLRQALEGLADDRPRMRELSRAAHERALGRFAWNRKALRFLEVYRWVLGQRAEKPMFDES
ncbi:MAG TPA: glycosyltransferase family 4 protein [Myxococcota bacterium]|nr:glycosyltransferase family 4 protein [Myxococcota bacterium]